MQLPQSTLIINIRGLFEENTLMKNYGSPSIEGKVRLEVNKVLFYVTVFVLKFELKVALFGIIDLVHS